MCAKLTMERYQKLEEMGRAPISLPSDIFFGGNEILQKTPGNHHRPQFRKTGTFNHPSIRAYRKRVAIDRANRLKKNKMSEVELRKIGGLQGLQSALAEFGLKINEEDMEVVLMNASALESDGLAKREYNEQQKVVELARLGIKYVPMVADNAKPVDVVKVTTQAQNKRVAADDDLSSLKDESEKDNNQLSSNEEASLSKDTDIVDTGEDSDGVKFEGGDTL